jgi:hypothetical protein
MQFIISAKAGLVNAVDGTANVRVQEQVAVGEPIQTGPSSRVEVLLNPSTFLRVDENSEVVLDSVDLANVQVRIISGSAIVDCGAVEKNSPIQVTDGTETLSISQPGTYRFPDGAAAPQLEDWNQQRSGEIAAANARSADTDAALNHPGFPDQGYPYGTPYGTPYYPGPAWPNSLIMPGIGAPLGAFSYFSPYGGYGFYQPFINTAPIVLFRPVIRPLPRPVVRPGVRPLPVLTPRPTVPVSRPTLIPSGPRGPVRPAGAGHVAVAHGHR